MFDKAHILLSQKIYVDFALNNGRLEFMEEAFTEDLYNCMLEEHVVCILKYL